MAEDLIPERVPPPAALVRDFVNTLDLELGTDELETSAGLAGFLVRQGLLASSESADDRQRGEAIRLRRGLHMALELNHAGAQGDVDALDEVLAELPVRLAWTTEGVVCVPADDGVAGALSRIGLAALDARASELWWRLKICAFDECEWAYYDHSKNRSRSYCEYGCGNKVKTRAYRARKRAES